MRSNILVLATLVLASPSLAWHKSESETPCKTHKTHTTQPSGPETAVTSPSYTPSGTSPPYPTTSAEGTVSSSPLGTGGGYSSIVISPTPSSYSSSAAAPTSGAEGGETITSSVAVYPTSAAQGASSSAAGYPTSAAEGGATSSSTLVLPVGGYNTTSQAPAPASTAGGTAPISGAGMNQVGIGSLLLGVIGLGLGFAFL